MTKWMVSHITGTFGKIILLAALYNLTGRLGLMMAVPPGYATVIWPPSGIALGMLIIYGKNLWPGILIGSFLLNCCLGNAYTPEDGFVLSKVLTSLGIAIGSTIQALFGRCLIKRALGLPLRLSTGKEIVTLFVLSGPLACIVASTTGTLSLYAFGGIAMDNIATNWLTWWAGDVFGIIVFLPLMLLAPGNKNQLVWRNNYMGTLPAFAILALIIPLGLTFYAWKIASEGNFEKAKTQFEALTQESEKALQHRINSYENALLGGEGFFQGSDFVSRQEWKNYVDTIHIEQSFPGINGVGLVTEIRPQDIPSYLEKTRKDGAPDFTIHPKTSGRPYYVITYIEPVYDNLQAVGLNIGFEDNRVQAAELSRDIGEPVITKRIILVQDAEKTPGFLLLHPMYHRDMPTSTTEDRRKAFRGWVYAPFIAKKFLRDLTRSQGNTMNMRIYDGDNTNPDNLIYSSGGVIERDKDATFTIRKLVKVRHQQWTIIWQSTPIYDQSVKNNNALYILVGGLLFTGMLGLFLVATTMQRTETMEWVTVKHGLVLPATIFLFLMMGAGALYDTLEQKELNYIKTLVEKEANKTRLLLNSQINDKLQALRRHAQRWEMAGGTPYKLWQNDAYNYTHDLKGLRTIEWIDKSYHVRWVEPLAGNEKAVGLNILFNEEREKALKGAADKKAPTMTPPLNLVQGYKAFIAYIPLTVNNRFNGFIAGIFSINDFFGSAITRELADNYVVTISFNGKAQYVTSNKPVYRGNGWDVEKLLQLYDKQWILRINPTTEYVESQRTNLSLMVLAAGLIISLLSSLTVRYILISRLQSAYLKTSEETFRSALEDASIGMALVSLKGKWLEVNQALSDLLGYTKEELQFLDFQSITHPDDLDQDLQYVSKVLAGEIKTYQMEKRYFHRNGQFIWALLNVSLVRNEQGEPQYFIAQIQDITDRKEMERIKSEFISIVSHELRTPLTSIRGSLGLMAGAMAKEIPEKANKLIDIAYKNSERLILLINDILDIDKIASGQMRFDMKDEPVEQLIQQAVESNQAYAAKFGASITAKAIDPSLMIRVDAQRFQQVITNLLSNAAKFSKEGDTVDVTTQLKDKRIRINVTDHGPGIPEEFRARIFGKFSQADSSATRAKGGTGLGLHISKQIVDEMGGTIGFNTKVDVGTTFWAEFPLVVPKDLETPNDLQQKTILICDDEEDIAFLIQTMLKKAGVEADIAHNIAQARQKLREKTYAAMALDLTLPMGDGIEFVRELRQDIMTASMPIIIVSARAEESRDEIRGEAFGIVDWLPKPLDEKQLVRTVFQAINASRGLPDILHVEDDADLTNVLATALSGKASIVSATSLKQAKQRLEAQHFDMVILDVGMPDGSGLDLLEQLPDYTTEPVPVLILSASDTPESIQKKVVATMVKSRMSETKIVETILHIIEQKTEGKKND